MIVVVLVGETLRLSQHFWACAAWCLEIIAPITVGALMLEHLVGASWCVWFALVAAAAAVVLLAKWSMKKLSANWIFRLCRRAR